MTFCAVICEYNPFHNGHRYQLEEIRKRSGCDKILCLMSGNFTQRGDMAVLNKYTRARHAAENGADVVLELPAAFAVSPAELFAAGAVHILASLPCVTTLAFGCESGVKEDFLRAAKATLSEDKQFKAALKENMKDGTSYVKARTKTVLALNTDIDEALLTSPNNILGTEYTRAILSQNGRMDILPVPRVGGGYADTAPLKNFSSATALRACMADGSKKAVKALKGNVPASVFPDLAKCREYPYKQAAVCALLAAETEEVIKCPDCSEGLENRLRAMAKSNPHYDELLAKVVSKRYTLSRLKRILLQNFLKITRQDVRAYLAAPLYCKVLAVKKSGAEEIFGELSKGVYPLLTRKSAYGSLKKEAEACFNADVRATDMFNALTGERTSEYETLFV